MSELPQIAVPRIALGSVQSAATAQPAVWALLGVLAKQGLQVQTFLPNAWADDAGMAPALSGRGPCRLDTWLMSNCACRGSFEKWCADADLALLHGEFGADSHRSLGGSLDSLCDCLDVPRLAVVDVAQLGQCRLPRRPTRLDGIVLDRVSSAEQSIRVATTLEPIWGAPVVATLRDGSFRRTLQEIVSAQTVLSQAIEKLAPLHLDISLDFQRLMHLARQRVSHEARPERLECACGHLRMNVAVAMDEAFGCCSEDTLEILESRGASIQDFSPLHSDRLPVDTDFVYLGCGHVERFADELSANYCLQQSLREYALRGGKVYAEGGAVAYLCRQVAFDRHRQLPMAGLLPANAMYLGPDNIPRPIEIDVRRGGQGHEGVQRIRGYLDRRWQVQPVAPMRSIAVDPQHRHDLLQWRGVTASRIYFHFAAQPALLPVLMQAVV